MLISKTIGLNAYTQALTNFNKTEHSINSSFNTLKNEGNHAKGFAQTLNDSLTKVNDLQLDKAAMITSFSSGETQNVHELMISMQKAGLAMQLTSAVRNKVMEAYKELSRLQF